MDRVIVQVQFKKFLWICPVCSQEDAEDRPVGGGASYEHTCSKCKQKFNQTHAKEYNGTVTYTPTEYGKLKGEELATEKSKRFTAWVTEIKNPPAYIEPSKEDLEKEKAELMERVANLDTRISEKTVVVEEVEPIEKPIERIK